MASYVWSKARHHDNCFTMEPSGVGTIWNEVKLQRNAEIPSIDDLCSERKRFLQVNLVPN